MPQKWYSKWDSADIVSRTLLLLVFLLVFGPFLLQFLYVGDHNAYRASCASNMNQLGLALVQYAQDNDGALPNYKTVDGQGWRETIYPYVKSTAVYQCPQDKDDTRLNSPENLPKSYAANHLGLSASHLERGVFAGPGEPPTTVNWKTVADTALTISVTDIRGYDGAEWNMTAPAFLPKTGRELYAHIPRHIFYQHPVGLVNLLFTDGHIKAMKPEATLSPVNLWTRDNSPFTGADLLNAQAILKHAEDE